VADYQAFFQKLGIRIRKLRRSRGYSQEDMMSFGFSTRHWQQLEAGRPITLTTHLRASEVDSGGLKFHCCRTISLTALPPFEEQRKTNSCVRAISFSCNFDESLLARSQYLWFFDDNHAFHSQCFM